MNTTRIAANFKTLDLGDVPHSRSGKNKKVVSMILRDLGQLKEGSALRVPLAGDWGTRRAQRMFSAQWTVGLLGWGLDGIPLLIGRL